MHIAARKGKGDVVGILLRNGANINEKTVKNTSVGETADFEREREIEGAEREQGEGEDREEREGERGSSERKTERIEENLRESSCISVYYCRELMFISFFFHLCTNQFLFYRIMYTFSFLLLFFFSFSFHLLSPFLSEIIADILSNGCLMSLCEELWAGMALREWA